MVVVKDDEKLVAAEVTSVTGSQTGVSGTRSAGLSLKAHITVAPFGHRERKRNRGSIGIMPSMAENPRELLGKLI